MEKQQIVLGRGGFRDWHIDLEALVEGRLLITGNSGSGKSRTLRRMIEQAAGRIQIIVIDREGEYSSLREKHDFLLIGGENGDTPVEVARAEALCRTLIEISASAVIDIYELTTDEQLAFVTRFLNEIMRVKPAERRHIMLVIDEADFFADQDNARAECTIAMKELAHRGRKRGLVPVMATNRPAQIAKSVSAVCVNKIIGRQSEDVDIARALKNLGFKPARANEVVELEPGSFWCKGPAFDEQAPTLVKVGSVETTHPRLGMKAPPPPPPSKRVAELLAALKAPIEAVAADVGAGLAQIGGEIRVDVDAIKAKAHQEGYDTGYIQGRIDYRGIVHDALRAIDGTFDHLQVCESPAVTAFDMKAVDGRLEVTLCPPVGIRPIKEVTRVALRELGDSASRFLRPEKGSAIDELHRNGRPKVTKGETAPVGDRQRLAFLAVLAEHGAMSRKRLHLWADYRQTGTSNSVLADMLKKGELTVPSPGLIDITAAGRKLVPNVKHRPKGGDALFNHVVGCNFLNSTEQRMMHVLKGNPKGITRAKLLEAVGIRSTGTANTMLSRLGKLGLADSPAKGVMQIAREFGR